MSELEVMKKQLEDSGLYEVTDGSLIMAELAAYVEGLDICFGELDSLEKNAFVPTAEGDGLQRWERLTGRPFAWSLTEDRRNAVIKALSVSCSDYTLSGMQKAAESFGVNGQLSLDSANNRIVFTCTDPISPAAKERLKKCLRGYMPLWRDFDIVT